MTEHNTSAALPADDAPITDTPADAVVAGPASSNFAALLEDAGFDKEAAEEIERTASPEVDEAMKSSIQPDTLKGRVALLDLLMDNTISMGRQLADMGSVAGMAFAAHDMALDTVRKVTSGEAVDVLVSTSRLNSRPGQSSALYPYMRIMEVAPIGHSSVELWGATPWYDRFAEQLAATAAEITRLEKFNKTVYGMCGLITDGFDNCSKKHTPSTLATIVRSFYRMKTFVPFVIYVGVMPQQGTAGYEDERERVLGKLYEMDVVDPELNGMSLEELIRRIFTSTGFDPKMVFLPGEDPRQIAQAFVTVSKLMASVSKGQMPEGLSEV